MKFAELKYDAKRNKVEIITVIGIILSIIVTIILSESNFQTMLIYSTLLIIILLTILVLLILVKLRRKFSDIAIVLQTQDDIKGGIYSGRKKHFTVEKENLSQNIVANVLPNLIKQICNDEPQITSLNVILDSGTTITPIFPLLMKNGVGNQKIKIDFFTNNLAGIDQIHKLTPEKYSFSERNFYLLGGRPLNTYRATTGLSSENIKEAIGKKETNKEEVVTIGILTANWFVIDTNYERISLCARGEGHFEFKQNIMNSCDYLLLIAPLGKILPTDIDTLNQYIKPEEEKYESLEIPESMKKKTFLITTLRPENSSSPISIVTFHLKKVAKRKISKNYLLYKECTVFEPQGDKYEVVVTELPHQYIRDNFKELYDGLELSLH